VPGQRRAGLVEVAEPLVALGARSPGRLREEGFLERRHELPQRLLRHGCSFSAR
jgi:hypothetical protein